MRVSSKEDCRCESGPGSMACSSGALPLRLLVCFGFCFGGRSQASDGCDGCEIGFRWACADCGPERAMLRPLEEGERAALGAI